MAPRKRVKSSQRSNDRSAYSTRSRYSSSYSNGDSLSPSDRLASAALSRSADPASQYSRDSYGNGASGASRRASNSYGGQKRSKKPFVIALIIVLALAAVVAGAAWAYMNTVSNKLSEGLDDSLYSQLKDTTYTGEPFYALLLGIDRSDDRENSDDFGTDDSAYRTDTMILARVDPQQKKVTLISLPRDTYVDMGKYGDQKLNAAYSIGAMYEGSGPAYAVKTVSELAGVDISYYAEIDFEGFCGVVDTIGGIEVDVPMEIDDDLAGGHLDAGLQTLNGEQALILCRSRHTYDYVGTGLGDVYRAANQRMVIGAIAKKLLNSDPVTLVSATSTAANYVKTTMSVTDLVGLANSMRGMDPSTDMYSATLPTTPEDIDGVSYLVPIESEWKEMMDRVKQGLSPTTDTEIDEESGIIMSSNGDGSTASMYGATSDSSTTSSAASGTYSGTVAVRNGSSTEGAAAAVAEKLSAIGFTTDTGNADSSTYTSTIVVYSTASKANDAAAIVSTLGMGRTMQNDGTYSFSTDFLVVVGADYKQ